MMLKMCCSKIVFDAVLLGAFGPLQTEGSSDVDGAGDHPLVERISGSFIRDMRREEFHSLIRPEQGRTNSKRLLGLWARQVR